MLINEYIVKITDNRKARIIYHQMDFYGQMDGYEEIERESYTTSWMKGEGNHSWEEEIFSLTELEKIRVRLRLNTPHNEEDHPIKDKETLEIIITKRKGGSLEKIEIENIMDKIEKLIGIRGIKNP